MPRRALLALVLVMAPPACVYGSEPRRRAQQARSPSPADSYERNALMAFKAGGDPWYELGSWASTGDPCSPIGMDRWFGVWWEPFPVQD